MRNRLIAASAAAAMAFAIATPIAGAHSDACSEVDTGIRDTVAQDNKGLAPRQIVEVGPYYVDVRRVTTGGGFSIWIYEESNNHGGLQPGMGKPGLPDPGGVIYAGEECTTKHNQGPDTVII